ncbi:MAG: hypothetical protein ACREEE_18440 [Dongiaceae bacterium]
MPAASVPSHTETAMRGCADELTVVEMLADPMVRAMMAVDRVRPADVLSLFSAAKWRVCASDGA